ncbi:GFA family protein [Pokkaliibacter sp. MBI-7]|uniref:GFA family protein n=1 Tax=Pokkaliibacter sp. MBI-7 TaxID=3040600 RepID=UPI00244BBDFC|nr:GFA family protein [Pokkaliibacter sp. MBI-7]MDH2435993.1 GFA family protein [Pokkaliibacter sp. MBI-7]
MLLKGSCHCGAVHFEVESPHPYPFNRCYCSVCRKTAGGGGYAINLGAQSESLKVEGRDHITVYHAIIDGQTSPAERHFCKHCATTLWVWDPRWPELVHPFASAIDTELPIPPERTHLMLAYKPEWVEVDVRGPDTCIYGYPKESIAEWHERLGLVS